MNVGLDELSCDWDDTSNCNFWHTLVALKTMARMRKLKLGVQGE